MVTVNNPNTTGPKWPFYYGYVIAAAGFVVWMISFGINMTFGIFLKPIILEFGWTRADTVFAYALGTFMNAFFAIFSGWLTDRLGPRIVVTIFGSFIGWAYLLMSTMNTQWQLNFYYGFIVSIGMSVATTPIMATVARWFVKQRGLVTGIVQAGLGLGGLIIAPLTGWLIIHYGWRSAYFVLGLIALISMVLSGLCMKHSPRDVGQYPDGAKGPDNSRNSATIQTGPVETTALTQLIWTREFFIITWLYAIFGFCRTTFMAHTAAYVQDLGFSLIDGSNVIAVIMVSSNVGRIGMGRVADILSNRSAFMISYAATTISLVWALYSKDLWGLYLFAFLFGFGWGGQAVLRFSTTAEAFGLNSLGLIMGVLGLGEAIASALGSYYAGYFFDIIGHYDPAFWAGIVLSIIGIVLAGLLKPLD